jgi:diguanylate cyclase (GGDEF)-like protein/PAS domain S-box-containing protein
MSHRADLTRVVPSADAAIAVDPLAVSTGGAWSRSRLIALVAGRTLLMSDRAGHDAPSPPWLAEAAAEVQFLDKARVRPILDVHPLDRTIVHKARSEMLQRPGELIPCVFRRRVGGELRGIVDTFVDLSGHDGLSVVTVRDDNGPAEGLEQWMELESSFEFESTASTLEYFDFDGFKLRSEGQVWAIYGRTPEEMIGHSGLEYIDERYHGAVLAAFLHVAAEPGRTQTMRAEVARPNGSRLWVQITLINRLNDDRVKAVIVLALDITEQLSAEEARAAHDEELRRSHEELRRSHDEFAVLADQVPAAVFRADGTGVILFANQHWRLLVGDADATHLRDVVAFADRGAVTGLLTRLASPDGPGEASIEVRSRSADRVFSLSCQAVGESHGSSTRPVIGSMTDVTSTTELRHLARHDNLTGLVNRGTIEHAIDGALAQGRAGVVIAFVDLDGFKSVNDGFGHDAGDEVLRVVATRLRSALRPTDEVARFGGDEFVVLCRDIAPGAKSSVAARIEAVLRASIEFAGGRWQPAASIGLARARAGDDLASFLRRADRAMYDVKRVHHADGTREEL